MTSARYITAQVRQRHPSFHWHDRAAPYYSIQTLGETWGDLPGTYAEIRERGLPTRYRYGGFAVMGDSVDSVRWQHLASHQSCAPATRADTMLWKEVTAPIVAHQYEHAVVHDAGQGVDRDWTGCSTLRANMARLFYIRSSDSKMVYRDYTAGGGFGTTYQYTGSPAFNFDGAGDCPDHARRGLCHQLRSSLIQGDVAPLCGRCLDERGHADALRPASAQLPLV